MKTCNRCEKRLPLERFYEHPHTADGYINQCKGCVSKRTAVHRAKNLDRIRKKEKAAGREPARLAQIIENTRQRRARNPERYKIHNRVHKQVARAVKKGLIKKPGKCSYSACKEKGKHKIESHHEDYSKPLVVKWLCIPCHRRLHLGVSKAAKVMRTKIAIPMAA